MLYSAVIMFLLVANCYATDELLSSGPWSKREGLMGASLGDEMMMAGGRGNFGVGFFNDVWTTQTGDVWVQKPKAKWSPRAYHIIVEVDGCAVVMAGQTFRDFYNDVWRSCDLGDTWELLNPDAGWIGRAGLGALEFKDRLIIAGGCYNDEKGVRSFLNDVWSSADGGRTWEVLTESAEWGPRSGLRLTSFRGRIYTVAGEIGFTPETQLADVWVSDTGAKWELASATPGYSARSGHGVVSLPDRMILLAGWPELTDSYVTTNGVNWTLANENIWNCHSEDCGKYDFWSLLHRDRLFTLGGSGTYSTFGKLYKETWSLDLSALK